MKKFLNSILAASAAAILSAIMLSGCSNLESSSVSSEDEASRAVVSTLKTIYSDLNPGFGKAVYFTGDFYEGNNWTTAVRGTYENGKWYCNVNTYKSSFEYKALTGDWGEETINAEFTNLTKIGEAENQPGYQGMPSGLFAYSGKDIAYGNAVYFWYEGGTFPVAYRGEYKEKCVWGYCPTLYDTWIITKPGCFYSKVTAYVGSYDLGETVTPEFTTLTWEAGENRIYK